MPSPFQANSVEKNKPHEQKESREKKEKTGEELTGENEKAAQELARSTQKNHEGGKEEKKWNKSFGSTTAKSPDGTIDITTHGFKFEKKDMEVTFGAAAVSEQRKPGEIPQQDILPGVSLNWKF